MTDAASKIVGSGIRHKIQYVKSAFTLRSAAIA